MNPEELQDFMERAEGMKESKPIDGETKPERIEIDYGDIIDEHKQWRLHIKNATVSAIGPETRQTWLYTTGSPVCLRPWFGKYQLSIDAVVDKYVERSATPIPTSELRDRIAARLEDSVDENDRVVGTI